MLFPQATTFHYPPFTTIEESPDGTKSYGGIEYKMFEAIAEALNFKFTISEPMFCCKWGGRKVEGSEGNLTGVVGDLKGRFADIGWNQLFYVFDWMQLFDYTAANNFAEASIMVRPDY